MITQFCLTSLHTGVTILLSLTVFLLMVAEALPATSDAVPVVGKLCQLCRDYFHVGHFQFVTLAC